eukprot:scaffold75605_cov32-Prasinocladus_malaysianus.AAC.2
MAIGWKFVSDEPTTNDTCDIVYTCKKKQAVLCIEWATSRTMPALHGMHGMGASSPFETNGLEHTTCLVQTMQANWLVDWCADIRHTTFS